MPTTSYGHELSVADDAGREDTPTCCGDSMTAEDKDRGYRDYTCGGCGTVLTISPSGLVFDITD